MNQKELNEIKRRLAYDKNCIGKIYGCYVSSNKEILAYIDESSALLSEAENDEFFAIMKKTLSGTLDKNLIGLEFTTAQVLEGEDHKLLMTLKGDGIKEPENREKLFQKIIEAVSYTETNFLILLALDSYDVPKKKDGDILSDLDSESVFSYILCSVCPVKDGKTELGFKPADRVFRPCTPNQVVANPDLGFMFPSFDDRASNIYKVLYYTKDSVNINEKFIESVFNTPIPMSAGIQKETFTSVLAETLAEECSYDVLSSVHEHIREKISEHKDSHSTEPLEITANEVGAILTDVGVTEEHVTTFKEKCKEEFGENATMNPTNIIDSKKFTLTTPQVKISVDPEYSYSVEARVINGIKYILIPANEGVELNGIDVKM